MKANPGANVSANTFSVENVVNFLELCDELTRAVLNSIDL
jgi:hypothetical protein